MRVANTFTILMQNLADSTRKKNYLLVEKDYKLIEEMAQWSLDYKFNIEMIYALTECLLGKNKNDKYYQSLAEQFNSRALTKWFLATLSDVVTEAVRLGIFFKTIVVADIFSLLKHLNVRWETILELELDVGFYYMINSVNNKNANNRVFTLTNLGWIFEAMTRMGAGFEGIKRMNLIPHLTSDLELFQQRYRSQRGTIKDTLRIMYALAEGGAQFETLKNDPTFLTFFQKIFFQKIFFQNFSLNELQLLIMHFSDIGIKKETLQKYAILEPLLNKINEECNKKKYNFKRLTIMLVLANLGIEEQDLKQSGLDRTLVTIIEEKKTYSVNLSLDIQYAQYIFYLPLTDDAWKKIIDSGINVIFHHNETHKIIISRIEQKIDNSFKGDLFVDAYVIEAKKLAIKSHRCKLRDAVLIKRGYNIEYVFEDDDIEQAIDKIILNYNIGRIKNPYPFFSPPAHAPLPLIVQSFLQQYHKVDLPLFMIRSTLPKVYSVIAFCNDELSLNYAVSLGFGLGGANEYFLDKEEGYSIFLRCTREYDIDLDIHFPIGRSWGNIFAKYPLTAIATLFREVKKEYRNRKSLLSDKNFVADLKNFGNQTTFNNQYLKEFVALKARIEFDLKQQDPEGNLISLFQSKWEAFELDRLLADLIIQQPVMLVF